MSYLQYLAILPLHMIHNWSGYFTGLAYVGKVCFIDHEAKKYWGASIIEDVGQTTWRSTAHEMGHKYVEIGYGQF